MSPRDTRTGSVLESMTSHSLKRGGYEWRDQVEIGRRFSGGRHIVDKVAIKGDKQWIVSAKWQQTSGTAEQKVPFEVICLLDCVRRNQLIYEKAYLILGGDGWRLREWYCNGGIKEYFDYDPYVKIVSLDRFVALANKGRL